MQAPSTTSAADLQLVQASFGKLELRPEGLDKSRDGEQISSMHRGVLRFFHQWRQPKHPGGRQELEIRIVLWHVDGIGCVVKIDRHAAHAQSAPISYLGTIVR
jgi:hypothetical protein